MHSFDILALTPPGLCDPSIAIAASRAGARGIIDLEFVDEWAAAQSAIERCEAFTTTGFGIKVGRGSQGIVEKLLEHLPERLSWIVLAGGDHDALAAWCQALRDRQITVLLEATSVAEMQLGVRLAVDGLLLKGNEAGGRVGEETAFVLLQRYNEQFPNENDRPDAWVQGGIGSNTAAACAVAGAAGVVLDAQLLLTKESPLGDLDQKRLSAIDGSETLQLGTPLGESYRVYNRPKCPIVAALVAEETRLETSDLSDAEKLAAWRKAIAAHAQRPETNGLLMLGQDAALARPLAESFLTVGGIVGGIKQQALANVQTAQRLAHLAEGAPLAESHRTRYPIVQGPMTRVSDTAAFADSVAAAGALPFLALALLRRAETEKLLAETKQRLGDRSWGVGILGFLPPEIRKEQVEAILNHKPPFALIAGGRPDQADELEKEGIPTYLHVPSPGLLKMFLRDGARRFVFEGRECGGHVGPRTSFLLWETMCHILLEHIGPNGKGNDLHVVFAGGIHDALSAAMVAALSAPLAERGVHVGALMGTAYLFTEEAVAAGGIVSRFQQEAVSCKDTVLLTTGPGHAIRCIKTPYFDVFDSEKRRLKGEGKSHEEIVKALEWMNIGRLRVASKGLDRVSSGGPSKLTAVSEQEQFDRGMYMIGQVASMRHRVVTMAQLHDDVCNGGAERLHAYRPAVEALPREEKPCDVAIIGMACHYPESTSLGQYWENILNKKYVVTEIPETHWDWRLFYDANPQAKDKIVSKWGGFLGDVPFDPLRYGITPKSMLSIEPLQLLLLESVRHALDDAGYSDRPFNRERTCAILGIGGGGSPLAVSYGFRACLPMLDTVEDIPVKSNQLMSAADRILPEWTEDSFPGFLMNVAVGRVANRFNFGGSNYAIDAACASSLAALHACLRELEMGTADVAVAMGADTVQTPYAYMAFSKTHALSQRGRCSPFDAAADGIVLSEGIGVVVLKRLADAERDGDKIYGVIKGVGSSSDGKEKGLTAPNAAGQLRAIRRAYDKAGISPARLGLIEAHGTGTVVGDHTEVSSLQQVMREAGAESQSCALGSVKSMIGHSKCAAGIAGLIKTAMALHTKALPPTLVETPNPKARFDESALYLNTDVRPWVHDGEQPRLAGVSAFGFGGTNVHVAMEEYRGDYLSDPPPALEHWPAELMVWRRATREEVQKDVEHCYQALRGKACPELGDLAASLWKASCGAPAQPTLSIVATSLEDLIEKLKIALEALKAGKTELRDPRGVYFAEQPADRGGKVALLFPGQGSQYPDMLSQQALVFPEVREALDRAAQLLRDKLDRPLGRYIYPSSPFSPQEEQAHQQALARTDVAQPAIGAATLGMHALLKRLGLKGDMTAGHSYGEYTALWAAGVMDAEQLIRISHRRGEVIVEAAQAESGTMAAIEADAETVSRIAASASVTVANLNSPKQTVISGGEEAIDAALALLQKEHIRGRRIPVACAFHSPLVASASDKLAESLAQYDLHAPTLPVYSNTTADVYPAEAADVAGILADHLKSPVRFCQQIEAMYEAGARVFVEVGPQGVLTGLVGQILGDRPHLAVASDAKGRAGLVQLSHLLGQLLTAGLPIELDRLYEHRHISAFDLAALDKQTGEVEYSKNTWVVNGIRSRLANGPEPLLLGARVPKMKSQATASPSPSATATALPAATASNGATTDRSPSPAASAGQAAAYSNGNGVPAPAAQPIAHSNGNGSTAQAGYAPVAGDEAAQVMMRFQDMMSRFLETQQAVMMSYLQGGNGAAPAAPLPLAQPQTTAAAPTLPVHPADSNGHATPQQVVQAAPPEETSPPLAETPAAAPSANGASHADEPAEEAEAPTFDRARIEAQLLDLVSERTGYPHDMLDVDLDLEADLGIDSIKRVEILGNLAELIGLSTDEDDEMESNVEFEKLTGIKTLRGILDYLEETLNEAPPSSPAAQSANGNGHVTTAAAATDGNGNGKAEDAGIERGLVELVDAPMPSGGSFAIPSGAILLTDDGRGIAQEIADRLADYGQQTVLLRLQQDGAKDGEGVFYVDLTDEAAVANVLARVRQQVDSIGGLVHLLPLAAAAADEDLVARTNRDVMSLYLLARALEDELCNSVNALLLAPTSLGGGLGFGDEPLPASYRAGHGGIIGFAKCLGMEWPDVMVRAVDFDGDRPIGEIVDGLLAELGDPQGPVEIGYLGKRRVTWQPIDGKSDFDRSSAEIIPNGATILLTGGARGITSAVAVELARRYQPNLILVGRSALPEGDEAPETASLSEQAEIKKALIDRMQREGRPAAPAAVEAAYQRLMRDREVRDSLEEMRLVGANVEYHQIDVRDEAALVALLNDAQQRFGGIDGVIHGAGVIEDKLLKDKTPESFDRVFGTKVESALALVRHLDFENLKFCVFFASIASRYGNRGQSDYAAANEVMSKLAWQLDRQSSCRVISIDWGPWSSVGMGAKLEKHLTARGLRMVGVDEGPPLLIDEINYGKKGQSEVMIAGGAENMMSPGRPVGAKPAAV